MNFPAVTLLVSLVSLLAYPVVPVAVAFATADGRLPRWARWWETHDNLGWKGPVSEGYPPTRWGLIRWLWRNKAYTLRWRYRALPDYRFMRWATVGTSVRPRRGRGYYEIEIVSANGRWWYRRWSFGLGLFSVYLHAGWKLQGFLEGARPGTDAAVSTGNFIGIAARIDDFGDN